MLPAVVGLAVYLVATTSMGIRLLRLWARTRLVAELTMGTAYIAGGSLGWSLVLAGHFPALLHTSVGLAIRTAAVFFLSLGSLALFVGTWKIYRPERRWLGVPAAALASVLVIEFVRNALMHSTPFVRADTPWYWPGALARAVPFVWSLYESLRYYRLLRRRLPLGLADPVVVNRLALWSVSGAATFVTVAIAILATVFNVDFRYAGPILLTYAALGLVGAVALWLAFFPPQSYLRRIQNDAEPSEP